MSNFTNTNKASNATLTSSNKTSAGTFSHSVVAGEESYDTPTITYDSPSMIYDGRVVAWTQINKS